MDDMGSRVSENIFQEVNASGARSDSGELFLVLSVRHSGDS